MFETINQLGSCLVCVVAVKKIETSDRYRYTGLI